MTISSSVGWNLKPGGKLTAVDGGSSMEKEKKLSEMFRSGEERAERFDGKL